MDIKAKRMVLDVHSCSIKTAQTTTTNHTHFTHHEQNRPQEEIF